MPFDGVLPFFTADDGPAPLPSSSTGVTGPAGVNPLPASIRRNSLSQDTDPLPFPARGDQDVEMVDLPGSKFSSFHFLFPFNRTLLRPSPFA